MNGASYLTVGGLVAWGTDDFTVEGFFAQTAPAASDPGLWQVSTVSGGIQPSYADSVCLINSTGPRWVALSNVSVAVGGVEPINSMVHVAVERAAGTITLYVEGAFRADMLMADALTGTNLVIGGYYSPAYLMQGECLGFRITTGVARYGGDFTPPTSPFPTEGPP